MFRLRKAEPIDREGQGSRCSVLDFRPATSGQLNGYNVQRLHGVLNDVPQVAREDTYHVQPGTE